MDIGVGKKGLSLTWQENFPEHADCPYCGGKETADIAQRSLRAQRKQRLR